jgi:uncharacterized protein involved in exopolysaccharide biosynthesis
MDRSGAAAGIANAFAQAYQRTNLELRVEPARQSAAWFDERMQQLRKDLEAAQTKLNAYQREKGFTAQDERLDLEQARLSELSMQYTAAQAQAVDATSRERQLTRVPEQGRESRDTPGRLGESAYPEPQVTAFADGRDACNRRNRSSGAITPKSSVSRRTSKARRRSSRAKSHPRPPA